MPTVVSRLKFQLLLQGDGSEDECIGCFSLFQFSCHMEGGALEGALASAAKPQRRDKDAPAAGGGSGSDSESGDDVALEVNSWWLEHLEERVRSIHDIYWCLFRLHCKRNKHRAAEHRPTAVLRCACKSNPDRVSFLQQGGHDEGQLQVLRWVYGGLACAQNLDFLDRQAEVLFSAAIDTLQSFLSTMHDLHCVGCGSVNWWALASLRDDATTSWAFWKRSPTHIF